MAQQVHIATVQLVIKGCSSEAEACDWVSENLRSLQGVEHRWPLLDWGYLMVGGQYLTPVSKVVADDNEYEEGSAL